MKQFVFLLIFFFPIISLGQDVNGRITDTNDQPIPNVFVISKITGDHWHTNETGEFQINKPAFPDSLIINHLGYKRMLIILDKKNELQNLIIKLERKSIELNEVSITGQLKSLNIISDIDLHTKPVNSSQEILRTVPGLIIGQHAGGGKAEQIFLRGFDIDHGTDINITVDGLPVNMVSHAHGQGYADLHFLIPEIIGNIDFGKGTYYADKGNFNTSGYVEFITKDRLEKSEVGVEYGSFNTMRFTSLLKILNSEKQSAYFAGEFLLTDGPFDASQNLNRINVFGKYILRQKNYDKVEITASHFTSKWDASGQIPQRSVDAGIISRFGAIDNTEGGFTGRSNVSLDYFKYINNNTFVKNKIFFSQYDFELYSNFTFFLNDPVNGDQIRQKESRQIYGAQSELDHIFKFNNFNINLRSGVGFLYNNIDNIELSHTRDRKITLEKIKYGDIDESNIYGFVNLEFDFGKFMINPAVRLDFFEFNYVDKLSEQYTALSVDKLQVSPKLNVLYNQSTKFQLFIKSGLGFHSNDTRVIVAETGREILPKAYGSDIGFIWKPMNRFIVNSSLWYLFLEQEFVYVGDEGVIEPSGKSQREGVDFGIRLQLSDYLFIDNDVNYAFARSIDEPEGLNYIPLAPDLTNTGGLSLRNMYGFSGGIRYRYIRNRPANEDNSIVAIGYLIADMNLSYSYKNIEIGLIIENVFNNDWNETQFATETRLENELESIEEIHFIPGTPFFIKSKLVFSF